MVTTYLSPDKSQLCPTREVSILTWGWGRGGGVAVDG